MSDFYMEGKVNRVVSARRGSKFDFNRDTGAPQLRRACLVASTALALFTGVGVTHAPCHDQSCLPRRRCNTVTVGGASDIVLDNIGYLFRSH